MQPERLQVAIVGAGPAGLSAALQLARRGVRSIAVLEREGEAGGVPRHCGHPPFGWSEYRRILTGPGYAARLRRDGEAAGIDIRLHHSVTALGQGGALEIATPEGMKRIAADRVILAMGGRETPRAPRLVGGSRPWGVTTTGALQAMVYLRHRLPFRSPLIVGTELVSFSALLTCRRAGMRPVAMVEEAGRPFAFWPCELYPRLLGVPLHLRTRIEAIEGSERVEGVILMDSEGRPSAVEADGIIFTGRFVPEASLLRESHLALDPATGGPVVDQNGRLGDPAYFAAGNLLRPIETAGWSWREGRAIGAAVASDLAGALVAGRQVAIAPVPPVRLVMPQRLTLPVNGEGLSALQLRVERPVKGDLQIVSGGEPIWRQSITAFPERRVLVPLEGFVERIHTDTLSVELKEWRPAA